MNKEYFEKLFKIRNRTINATFLTEDKILVKEGILSDFSYIYIDRCEIRLCGFKKSEKFEQINLLEFEGLSTQKIDEVITYCKALREYSQKRVVVTRKEIMMGNSRENSSFVFRPLDAIEEAETISSLCEKIDL